MSDTTTRGIQVQVESDYVPERSSPEESLYFFSYTVRISNHGKESAQLISREWIITDLEDRVEKVRGPGVVGEQPLLRPGESFVYTSFCPLKTPFGSMEGHYSMITAEGEAFDARIPFFALAMPHAVN